MRVKAEIEIEVQTITGDINKACEYRKRDLESWVKRHMPDIEAVVCSTSDTLQPPRVWIEKDEVTL